ncbi:hypothetical protein BN1002_00920 [Bacillus sp. B-jedd]|nr:hypothetical protein BN1002_00920 [Bacillus sp. B-jedd]
MKQGSLFEGKFEQKHIERTGRSIVVPAFCLRPLWEGALYMNRWPVALGRLFFCQCVRVLSCLLLIERLGMERQPARVMPAGPAFHAMLSECRHRTVRSPGNPLSLHTPWNGTRRKHGGIHIHRIFLYTHQDFGAI